MLSNTLSSNNISWLGFFDKNIERFWLFPPLGIILLISVLIVSALWPLSAKEFSSINYEFSSMNCFEGLLITFD